MDKELQKVGAEVMVWRGMHQFQHGRIASIETATEIPFLHLQLRGAAGQILVNSGAYLPLKYCTEVSAEVVSEINRAAKALRRERRMADKAAMEKFAAEETRE